MVPVCDKRYHIYNRFRHFWAEIKKLWNYPLHHKADFIMKMYQQDPAFMQLKRNVGKNCLFKSTAHWTLQHCTASRFPLKGVDEPVSDWWQLCVQLHTERQAEVSLLVEHQVTLQLLQHMWCGYKIGW